MKTLIAVIFAALLSIPSVSWSAPELTPPSGFGHLVMRRCQTADGHRLRYWSIAVLYRVGEYVNAWAYVAPDGRMMPVMWGQRPPECVE